MPAARPSWAMRTMDASTSFFAVIMRSASSSMTMTMLGSFCSGNSAPSNAPVLDELVVALEAAHAHVAEDPVAPIHLGHAPLQGRGGLAHVGDDRHDEVRDAVVVLELDLFGVDHDEAHVLGGVAHQEAHHDPS